MWEELWSAKDRVGAAGAYKDYILSVQMTFQGILKL